MDRGFGSALRGFGSNNRDRLARDERRYDDFYSNNRRSGSSGSNSGRNSGNQNRGNWGSSIPRDRGFFNQGNRNRGTVNGQMIAALQQQQTLLNAFMSNQSNRNLNVGNKFNQQNRFNSRDNRGGNRVGDKRKNDVGSHGGKRNRRSEAPPRQEKKVEVVKIETVIDEVDDIPDDEVEIPDSVMDSVERLRQRTEVERNVADEDVKKLLVFCFTGKGYQCLTCGLLLSKEESFTHHLMGKSHVMNVIDARTAKKYQTIRDILDIDLAPDDWFEKNEKAKTILLKQAKLFMKSQREQEKRERENYEKNAANFFTVNMATRKTARKDGDKVAITSLVESTIEVKEFNKDRFFGCEFVKAVTGFHCRLCNMQIKEASGVIGHVSSRVHKNNYQVHLNRNKTYEKVQSEQNKELLEVLSEHESKNVLLHETDNANDTMYLKSLDVDLVREKKLLEPREQKSEEKKETKKESEVDSKEKSDETKAPEETSANESEDKNNTAGEDLVGNIKEEEEENEEVADSEETEQTEEAEKSGTTEEEENTVAEGDEVGGEAEEHQEEETTEPSDEVTNEEQPVDEKLETEVEEVKSSPKTTAKTIKSSLVALRDVLAAKKNANVSRRGTSKRGRGRGGRVSASPRSRRSAGKAKTDDAESQETAEAAPVESFEIVDDIDEE